MSKRNRELRRSEKQSRKVDATVDADRLKITVVTSPNGGLELHDDIRLVKAALLYADHVDLISPVTQFVGAAISLADLDAGDLAAVMLHVSEDKISAHGHDPTAVKNVLELIKRYDSMTRSERRQLPKSTSKSLQALSAQVKLNVRTSGMVEVGEQIYRDSNAAQLEPALESSLLTIRRDAFEIGAETSTQMTQLSEAIKALLIDPSAHLMFSDQIQGLANAFVAEGLVEPHTLALRHSAEAATSAGFVQRLPAFPDAEMERLLEARDELSPLLAPYRQAVVEMTKKMEGGFLDPAQEQEIIDLWRNEVRPSIEAYREGLSRKQTLKDLVPTTVADPTSWAIGSGPALYTFFTDQGFLASSIAAATGITLSVARSNVSRGRELRTQANLSHVGYLSDLDQQLKLP